MTPNGGNPAGNRPFILSPGDVLAERFRLERCVGQGGIGSVWLARDAQLDNDPVACKVLKETLQQDRRAVADLKREVLLTRRLRHPHILAVYTFWETDDTRFITMEYVEGANLADVLIDRGGTLALDDLLPWLHDISAALDYAHGQEVLHRDVKPANMLLDATGEPRLADFGIARTAREVTNRLTGELSFGTLVYVSPEQLMGEELDARSDQYSFAASIYELLSGHPPFHQGSIVTQIQFKPAPPVPGVSHTVNQVLLRGLAKRPEDRFDSCDALVRALRDAARGQAPRLSPPSTPLVDTASNTETRTLPRVEDMLAPLRLGALLVEAGVISSHQRDAVLEEQRRTGARFGTLVLKRGNATEDDIARALCRQLHLARADFTSPAIDRETVQLLPRRSALKRCCVPLRREGATVYLAMADPLDLATINEMEASFRINVVPLVATESEIRAFLAGG